MSRTFTSYKAKRFSIENKPIYSGGEGAIYRVVGSAIPLVAKIYHTPEKARMFEQKILFMVNNPPFGKGAQAVKNAIIWPQDLLFENNTFVGYVMPMVNQGIKLFSLYQPNFPRPQDGAEWQKFSRMRNEALLIRMKICYNLARAIDLLHQTKKYIVVDLKPENILVKPNGHFSLIDLDSIQIREKGRLLFNATAYTPEYAPPEFHRGQLKFSKDIIPESFDNFAFAVILYQVLLAIHPFQASHQQYTTLEENIRNGLFVHGGKKKQLHVIPQVHQNFSSLPKSLKELFMRALDHGSINPAFRPTTVEWSNALISEINSFSKSIHKPINPHHHWNNVQKASPPKGLNDRKKTKTAQSVTLNAYGKHQFAGCQNQTQRISNGTKHFMRSLSLRNLMPFLKRAAMLLFVIFAGYALWDMVYTGDMSGSKLNDVQNNHFATEIAGKYYGFIQYADKQKQVAYLQIKRSEKDKSRFAIQLIRGIQEDSVFEEIKIDHNGNLISSKVLGEGVINYSRYGKTTLASTENTSRSWYFEK